MATQRAMDEADIRQRVNQLVEGIRAMDLESVTSICAPNLVSYDVGPVLRQTGAEAKRKNWVEAFAMFQPPLGYEFRDLEITVGDDVAFGHSVNRLTGTMKNGKRSDVWVRWTACFRKIDGNWLMCMTMSRCLSIRRQEKRC